MSLTPMIEIGELAAMLSQRIESLVAELLPLGHREGNEWVEAHRNSGGLGDGLRVVLRGSKMGVWAHFGDNNAQGDALDLVAYLLFDRNKAQAIDWSKVWLGLASADPATLAAAKKRAAQSRGTAAREAEADRQKRATGARALWLSAQQLGPGCPAWVYLAGRGCDLGLLDRVPGALRYHPKLYNRALDAERPALVANITTRDGRMAVHRTWLEPDPKNPGSWRKLSVVNPKMTYGTYKGGSIHLWRGASGQPIKKAQPGELVCITEGIEDGLSVAIAMPKARVLVAVSLSNMANISLPETIEEIVLCADNDPAVSTAAGALDRAVTAHLCAGRRVRVARPRSGAKDFNAVLTTVL